MILQLVSEGKCFSFLNGDMHLDMYLTEVRARLEVEAEELMPSSYTFLYGNIPVTAKQESLLTLRHLCLEKSEGPETGKDIYVLQFLKTKTCEKHQTPVQKAAGLDAWLKEEKQFSTPQSKTDKKEDNVPTHRSRNSTIKVELYTNEEILAQTCWLERERMAFWNIKVNEMSVSKETAKYQKTELLGVIETAWTLKKAKILQVKTAEPKVMHERLKTVYFYEWQNLKKTSNDALTESVKIHENNELILKTLTFIRTENRRLSSEISKTNRAQAEYLYELKRASDALFKSLTNQEMRLSKFQEANRKEMKAEWCDGEVLSVAEENDIAEEIKNERTMNDENNDC